MKRKSKAEVALLEQVDMLDADIAMYRNKQNYLTIQIDTLLTMRNRLMGEAERMKTTREEGV